MKYRIVKRDDGLYSVQKKEGWFGWENIPAYLEDLETHKPEYHQWHLKQSYPLNIAEIIYIKLARTVAKVVKVVRSTS